jgi:hypothetical protein
MGKLVDGLTARTGSAARFGVYVSILTAAYYYNITFVQLGVTGAGEERLGLSMELVAVAMGLLAVATLTTTLVSGYLMDRLGWGRDMQVKFRVLFGVLFLQTGVTYLFGSVSSFPGFLGWVLACSVLLGTAIPFAFSLLLDLVVPAQRGYAAGAVAACAFALAALVPFEWAVGNFTLPAVVVLTPIVVLLGLFSFAPGILGRVERRRGDGSGGRTATDRGFRVLTAPVAVGLALLFGAFFVDSLGFVRIIETSALVDAAWRSPDYGVRVTLSATHVVGGLVAGLLYARARYLWLFAATFALFAAAQLLFACQLLFDVPSILGTAVPLVYVLAVSCYTTVTFALWPDLATPETVGRYTAVGVGVGGWLATFTSTALALLSDRLELAVEHHLLGVGVVSLLFLFLTLSLWSLTPDVVHDLPGA